ncbi:MAG: hypothetical protein QG579_478, partial [Patescibacteria group bacterium]|nr:hypothetical protein [Patescibacteria group bacterium]
MKDFLPKLKLFYKKIATKQENYKRRGIEPSSDWSVIVIVSASVFCVLGLFGYYVFYRIKNDQLFTVKEAGGFNEVRINKALLKKTIDDINTREASTTDL